MDDLVIDAAFVAAFGELILMLVFLDQRQQVGVFSRFFHVLFHLAKQLLLLFL